jgi:hypothetical protein
MPLFIGIITGRMKKAQQRRLSEQAKRQRASVAEFKAAKRERTAVEGSFVAERAAALAWLQPTLNRSAQRLGLRKSLFGPGGALGGITYEGMRSILAKAREALILPRAALDRVVGYSFAAAIVLEGIDALDRADLMEVPILHENVADVLSDMDIPGAEGLGEALAEFGWDTVGDILGDLFIVAGVAKGAYNIAKATEFSNRADRVAAAADKIESKVGEERTLSRKTIRLREALEGRAFEAFKWSQIAHVARSRGLLRNTPIRERITANFTQSFLALWDAHKLSPKQVSLV